MSYTTEAWYRSKAPHTARRSAQHCWYDQRINYRGNLWICMSNEERGTQSLSDLRERYPRHEWREVRR